jgi:hypothetical protein
MKSKESSRDTLKTRLRRKLYEISSGSGDNMMNNPYFIDWAITRLRGYNGYCEGLYMEACG